MVDREQGKKSMLHKPSMAKVLLKAVFILVNSLYKSNVSQVLEQKLNLFLTETENSHYFVFL